MLLSKGAKIALGVRTPAQAANLCHSVGAAVSKCGQELHCVISDVKVSLVLQEGQQDVNVLLAPCKHLSIHGASRLAIAIL